MWIVSIPQNLSLIDASRSSGHLRKYTQTYTQMTQYSHFHQLPKADKCLQFMAHHPNPPLLFTERHLPLGFVIWQKLHSHRCFNFSNNKFIWLVNPNVQELSFGRSRICIPRMPEGQSLRWKTSFEAELVRDLCLVRNDVVDSKFLLHCYNEGVSVRQVVRVDIFFLRASLTRRTQIEEGIVKECCFDWGI